MPKGIYKRKPFTEEHKKNISNSHVGLNTWTKNKPSNATGKHWKLSKETKKKIGLASKGRTSWTKGLFREKSHRWIKDRTKLKRYIGNEERRSSAYSNWRKEVWLRDGFKCKIANPDCKGRLEAHHILSWREYPELRYEVNNGISLCHAHHPHKWTEEKRLSPYFKDLISKN